MKYIFFLFLFPITASAQPTAVKQAIVYTTTNIIAPEEEEVQNMQNQQSGGFNFRNMMDGEIKFITYVKNDLVKTVIKSDMGRSTIFRNNTTKMTTTLLEIMGNKNGFYISDDEQAAMKIRRDSMMAERRKKDSSAREMPSLGEEKIDIAYTEETKKIAGYDCKKAYLITTRLLGLKDTAIVWFTNAFRVENVLSTGGLSGMGNMMGMGNAAGTLGGLEKVNGFVLRYEMKLRRNRKMEVEVTKIELDKEIDDKEFDIPKNIELKPMSEMRNMFGGQGGRGN